MSKYDHGKHNETSPKRLDGQKPSKQLFARIAGYDEAKRSADPKLRPSFNKPGSQQRRSK